MQLLTRLLAVSFLAVSATAQEADVPPIQDVTSVPAVAGEQVFEVIALEHAAANELAVVLSTRLAHGVSLHADPRTNSLLVSADAAQLAEVRDTVRSLDRRQEPSGASIFPPANADMVIAVSDQGDSWTMMDLIKDYGRLTNQHIQIGNETRGYLESIPTGLTRSVVVPAAEVQAFVEHLIVQNNFVLDVLRVDEPRLLSLYSLQTGQRNTVRQKARFVPHEQLAAWASHPTVLVTTVLHLPNTDVRQLSNSMRTMITDANTQQMLPAGNTNSIVLTGFAPTVSQLAHMLRLTDEASRSDAPEPIFDRFPLQHAQAAYVAPILEELVASSYRVSTAQNGNVPDNLRHHANVRVMADERTNALLVMAKPYDIPKVERLVKLLDVETD